MTPVMISAPSMADRTPSAAWLAGTDTPSISTCLSVKSMSGLVGEEAALDGTGEVSPILERLNLIVEGEAAILTLLRDRESGVNEGKQLVECRQVCFVERETLAHGVPRFQGK